ncbi:hypothetical protein QN277_004997 [Acacia crassicarpa]|uniref:Uncharacterized protein n=1 Tax=Acacia crassicarpa TaxID=499986 RepID=A0AAE1JSK4_9FABA|nr:hypothetical protein QN277_004997 [Acacia crassicarpa]
MSTFSDTEANGRRTGSNFSQTCNLFRQFLKEKRGCGAISLGMSGKKIEPRGRFNLCLGLPTKCLLSSGSSGPNRADALLVCSGAKTYPLFQSSSQTSSIKLSVHHHPSAWDWPQQRCRAQLSRGNEQRWQKLRMRRQGNVYVF